MITSNRFGRVMADLLLSAEFTRKNNNPDWVTFVEQLPGVSYERLRNAVAGDRPPSEELMRIAAQALKVEPTVFGEYRLLQAQRQFDPTRVGWTRATEALAAFEANEQP